MEQYSTSVRQYIRQLEFNKVISRRKYFIQIPMRT